MFKIKEELEDLSFKYLYPDKYFSLKSKVEEKIKFSEDRLNEYAEIIKKRII